MKNKLHILFDDIKNKFEKDLNDNFIDGDRIVGKINQAKKIRLEKKGVIGGLKTILNKSNEKNANEFLENINSIRTFLPFCSTPKAFKTAWELRAKSLSINDAEAIVKLGGQFIPENTKVRIFKTEMQGNLYHNKKFMKAVRHSEGNYEDKLDDLGNFRYEPLLIFNN